MTDYNVWRTIETDEFYKQYLDVKKKQELKSDIYLQGLSVAEQIKKLSDGISVLDKELQKQVLSRHEDLLSQATWVEKLEAVLAVMQIHVQSLLSAVERLRTKIVEPFSKVELQTVMLSRLHATSDLLRRVARIQHLTNRLNTQMAQGFSGSSVDIIKAAQSLNELAQLSEDVDLSGLEVLEEDQRSIRTHRSEIERQGKLMLTQGLQSQNHAQVSTAIRVFHQLDTLKQSALQVVRLAEQNLSEEIKQALDLNTLAHTVSSDAKTRAVPGRVPLTTSTEVSAFRSRLWVALDHVYDLIYSNCCQVELLQRMLSRKLRDAGSATAPHSLSYLDLLPADNRQLAHNFWLAVTTALSTRLHHLAHKSSFAKQALEGEYPKFLSHYLELCKRLQATCQLNSQSEFGMSGSNNKSQTTVFEINRDVVAKFEATYLSRSESRLLDPVDLMFSGKTVPTHEEVDAVIRDMASQLSASLVDVCLIRTVAQNISKIIRMFCSKCEAMISTDGEATQVIDVSTPGQMLNVSIANLLHYLNGQVLRVFSNMKSSIPKETFSMVIDSLSEVDAITENILKPLLASVADSIEAIILTMHNEDYSMNSVPAATTQMLKKPDAACSLYMKELQGFISRAVNNYLAKFDNQEIVSKCCIPVAVRCVELFLQHACLIRPLGEGGRMKLASDFAQVELAVAPLCPQLSELGQLYRLLRSFRPLLFQTVEDVALCPTLGDVIPYSLVLLSLFARGPEELLSPHQSASWSVSRFSHWLDTHRSERERLELMSGALQRYQQTVRQKGDTSFHPVYPVMISLLERGIAHATMQT